MRSVLRKAAPAPVVFRGVHVPGAELLLLKSGPMWTRL